LPTAASVTWVTRRPPRFLPDEIDGRALFQLATRHVQGDNDPANAGGIAALGDIVVTLPLRQARAAALLTPTPMFSRFTPTGAEWRSGPPSQVDSVVRCGAFRPDLSQPKRLHLQKPGATPGATTHPPTQCRDHPAGFFLGYGRWWGPASATLLRVGAPA